MRTMPMRTTLMKTKIAAQTAAGLLLASIAGQTLAQPASVMREGAGERRNELNELERTPLPASVLNSLESWSTGSAPSTSGKVVLIVTWASWYPQSWRVLSVAESLAKKHGEDLVVIGIHHSRGFDRAERIAGSQKISFPYAHDAEGTARDALLVDQDPDFYVVDRAGQLRFADIATGSVTAAVDQLIAESAGDASSLNERLAAAEAERRRTERTTTNINNRVDLRELPEVAFDLPTPEQYEDARWPEMPNNDRRRSRGGEDETWSIQIGPGDATFFPTVPALRGRATLLYFWNPTSTPTYRALVTRMDRIQRRHGRDLVVVSVATPISDRRRRGNEDTNLERNITNAARGLAREVRLAHTIAINTSGSIMGQATGDSGRVQYRGTAPVAIVSSDGVVRWTGGDGDRGFESALEQILLVDPGVKARAQAEAEYIRRAERQRQATPATDADGESESDGSTSPASTSGG